MTDLDKLDEALAAGRRAVDAKEQATVAVKAIRALEGELRSVAKAAGGHLRGTPNLAGPGANKLFGYNVRATDPCKALSRTATQLVLTADARLCLSVWLPAAHGFALRPVADDELLVEDAAAVATTATWVLDFHVRACERTEASYREASELAGRILVALRGGGA